MEIKKIEAYPISIPYMPGFELKYAWGSMYTCNNLVVKIFTDEGIVGLGEVGSGMEWETGETPDTTVGFLRAISPLLIKKDPFNLEEIQEEVMDTVAYNRCAKAAIDIALYDIIGKALNVPVYKLLGGRLKSEVPMHICISMHKPEEMAKEAAMRVNEGYRTLELKFGEGSSVGEETERVRQIRNATGDETVLIVDPNESWTPQKAIRIINNIEKYDVYVEQPCPGIKGLKQIRDAVSVPIIADDVVHDPEVVLEIIQMEAADAISIKMPKVGGIYKARRITAIAESAGMPYRFDGLIQTRLASTACLHLSLASREIFGGYTQFMKMEPTKDLVKKGGIVIEHGVAKLVEGPGLGVEIRDELLGHAVISIE